LDGSAPPRRVAGGGDKVNFGRPGELVFRQFGTPIYHLARVKTDGTDLERILPVLEIGFVSPDGNWVTLGGPRGLDGTVAFSLKDRTQKPICRGACQPRWSADGKYLYVTMNPIPTEARPTLVFSIPKGGDLPVLPPQGLGDYADRELVGVPKIPESWPGPGPDPQTYAFEKSEFVANLFRIPVH
jgi:hypothetical protein